MIGPDTVGDIDSRDCINMVNGKVVSKKGACSIAEMDENAE